MARSGNDPVVTSGPPFPKATDLVQRGDLEFARHTNERTRASYFPRNFEPVAAAGRWSLLEGDQDILPGISARVTPGHVPYHQGVILRTEARPRLLADLFPTRPTCHSPGSWGTTWSRSAL